MKDFLNTPFGLALMTYVKSFLAVVLGLFLIDGADIFNVTAEDLRVWLAAGIASVLPVLIGALNPNDKRYGVNKETK